jgi:Putative Flp pilus-assembly TadE/G-like
MDCPRSNRAQSGCCDSGQSSLLVLGVVGAVLVGAALLFAFGNALGAKSRHQRAADLAAISAAQVMRDLYPRLFEPPFIDPDVPNPRHLEEAKYPELAGAAAVRGPSGTVCACARGESIALMCDLNRSLHHP